MRKATVAWAFVTACGVSICVVSAQRASSYTWYGQLASVDQDAKTITVKAQIRAGVTRYVGDVKPGDKLMLTWTPIQGESDSIIYAPKLEVMKGITDGYILPVEFVSADAANHTLTFKTMVPENVVQIVKSIQPGQWIKVTTPMQQPREGAAITAIAATEKPDLKPPPPPPEPKAMPAGRGRGAAAPSAGAAGTPALPGTWTIAASVGGNAVNSECTFKQEGTKLTGTCTSQLGQSDLTGEINGNAVKFRYKVNALEFEYAGTLESSGTAMTGMVSVSGTTANFSATKK